MPSRIPIFKKLRDQHGAILVMVAILFAFVFIGLLALAIDVGHLVVVRNELQNGADAGALASALNLYYDEQKVLSEGLSEELIGTVNPEANQEAHDTATQNQSDQNPVEVYNPDTNSDDVQRGHWNPDTRTFTPSDSLEKVSLVGVTAAELNAMEPFINAVRVKAWRGNPNADTDATPVTAFFARIFGIDSFTKSAQATAWLGYASHIAAGEVDLPLALCEKTLKTDEALDCNIGRRLNSSGDLDSTNTGGWTDFTQAGGACTSGGASASTVGNLFNCNGSVNPNPITFGWPMAATGGEVSPVYADILDCWQDNHENVDPATSWSVVLPVIDCDGHNVDTCPVVTHVVQVEIVFVSSNGTAQPADTPYNMDDWSWANSTECDPYKAQAGKSMTDAIGALKQNLETIYRDENSDVIPDSVTADRWQGESTYTSDIARWDCFTDYFQLKNADDNYAPLAPGSIYFKPDCTQPTDVVDGTGDENFGFLSKRPVLVE